MTARLSAPRVAVAWAVVRAVQAAQAAAQVQAAQAAAQVVQAAAVVRVVPVARLAQAALQATDTPLEIVRVAMEACTAARCLVSPQAHGDARNAREPDCVCHASHVHEQEKPTDVNAVLAKWLSAQLPEL